MILLGIETATELVGAAVADADGPRAAVWATGRRQHAESLAPAIAHVLDQAGLDLADLDAVAVDVGPGLFTGLRVGVATAKGIAQGLDVGVVPCTSVDVLAAATYDAGWTGPVVAAVDARRGEVFAARYRPDPAAAGAWRQVSPPARFTPAALAAALATDPAGGGAGAGAGGPGGWLAVGDGARRYADVLAAVPDLRVAGPASPPPDTLATLAARRLAVRHPVAASTVTVAGDRGDATDGHGPVVLAPAEVQPIYLREADARINWTQRDPVRPVGG